MTCCSAPRDLQLLSSLAPPQTKPNLEIHTPRRPRCRMLLIPPTSPRRNQTQQCPGEQLRDHIPASHPTAFPLHTSKTNRTTITNSVNEQQPPLSFRLLLLPRVVVPHHTRSSHKFTTATATQTARPAARRRSGRQLITTRYSTCPLELRVTV